MEVSFAPLFIRKGFACNCGVEGTREVGLEEGGDMVDPESVAEKADSLPAISLALT